VAVLVARDQVLIGLELTTDPAGESEELTMKVKDVGHCDRFERRGPHDLVYGVAIAGKLLLIPIAKPTGPDILSDQALDPPRVHDYPLDRARSSDRGNACLVRKCTEQFRELGAEESLPAAPNIETSQSSPEPDRLGTKRSVEIDEAMHPINTN
jgi:hypothetical protein